MNDEDSVREKINFRRERKLPKKRITSKRALKKEETEQVSSEARMSFERSEKLVTLKLRFNV